MKLSSLLLGLLRAFLCRNVANIALNDAHSIDSVYVANELDMDAESTLGFERQGRRIVLRDLVNEVQRANPKCIGDLRQSEGSDGVSFDPLLSSCT
jgi:hypothetical protein